MAPSAARWPSRSATAAAGRSPAIRTPAALPAPGRESVARYRPAACLTVSEARQTTTPPVSLNFAGVSHGVRSGVASSNRCGRPPVQRDQLASCGSPATARSRWLVRRSKLSPKKRAIARRGQRRRHLGAAGPGQKQRGRDHRQRGRDDGERPDRAQHPLTPQLDQIAGRDDHGQSRHQQRDAGAADDAIEIEQAGDQAAAPARGRWRRNKRNRAPADRPAADR